MIGEELRLKLLLFAIKNLDSECEALNLLCAFPNLLSAYFENRCRNEADREFVQKTLKSEDYEDVADENFFFKAARQDSVVQFKVFQEWTALPMDGKLTGRLLYFALVYGSRNLWELTQNRSRIIVGPKLPRGGESLSPDFLDNLHMVMKTVPFGESWDFNMYLFTLVKELKSSLMIKIDVTLKISTFLKIVLPEWYEQFFGWFCHCSEKEFACLMESRQNELRVFIRHIFLDRWYNGFYYFELIMLGYFNKFFALGFDQQVKELQLGKGRFMTANSNFDLTEAYHTLAQGRQFGHLENVMIMHIALALKGRALLFLPLIQPENQLFFLITHAEQRRKQEPKNWTKIPLPQQYQPLEIVQCLFQVVPFDNTTAFIPGDSLSRFVPICDILGLQLYSLLDDAQTWPLWISHLCYFESAICSIPRKDRQALMLRMMAETDIVVHLDNYVVSHFLLAAMKAAWIFVKSGQQCWQQGLPDSYALFEKPTVFQNRFLVFKCL